MIDHKIIKKKYFSKNKTIEGFSKKNKNEYFLQDHVLIYFPFFIRYPIQFFLWMFWQSFKEPIYLLILFGFFSIMKRTVKNNTFDWTHYSSDFF